MKAFMAFPICSLIFISLLTIAYFLKPKIKSMEISIYKWLISFNIVGLILEILCYFAVDLANELYLLSITILKLYVVYIFIWSMIFNAYVWMVAKNYNESNQESIKKFNILKNTTIIICTFVSILLMFLPIEIYNDGTLCYTYGPITTVLLILLFIIVFTWIVLCIKNFKKLKQKKYIPIIACVIVLGIVLLIQSYDRSVLIATTGHSLIVLLMYFTIENPDVKMIKELNAAKDQAEKANRAKTDFLSNMSHEIRTPLNAIVGFSECMLDSNDLKETKEYSQDIVDASKQLLEIVNGILDISKIEANKVEIIPKNYNPREVFDGLRKLVLPRIKEKPIEFKMTFSPDLPGILRGDVSKVKQIILNILTNAAKYTDKGEIIFNVNCINRLDTKVCLMYISVKDTGHGIKKDKLETIFGKFERVDEDKNTTTEGTGLGLAITKSLVDLMGGRITVFSKYGEGSTFRIYLEQEIVNMEIPKTDDNEELEINYKQYDGKKILIVDDSKINLKVAQTIMKPYNFEIDTAISGEEALEKVNNKHYDLIFMDIMMPKMNGVETLYKLRENEEFSTPVIALTADAIEGTDEKYLSVGFNSYLSKPIDRKLLNKVINKYLGGK